MQGKAGGFIWVSQHFGGKVFMAAARLGAAFRWPAQVDHRGHAQRVDRVQIRVAGIAVLGRTPQQTALYRSAVRCVIAAIVAEIVDAIELQNAGINHGAWLGRSGCTVQRV